MLRDVGRRLLTAVRASDLVARYGGDEFVVVCEIGEPSDAVEIAERILDLFRAEPTGSATPLSASIGIAVVSSGHELVADQLLRRADLAMYRAKSAGGNRIVLEQV